jgi:hypothetical protein
MVTSHKLKYTLIRILNLFFPCLLSSKCCFELFMGMNINALFLNWLKLTICIHKKIKIRFDRMTICFGYKCIECFFTFFLEWKERVLCPKRLYICERPISKLETLKTWMFVRSFDFSFFSIYNAWYCQEVYVHGNCVGAMNCALIYLEWNALFMLHLEKRKRIYEIFLRWTQ